jgi:perosamine synthetase
VTEQNRPQQTPLTAPFFDRAEVEAIERVLASGWVTQGPATKQLEAEHARRHGTKFALATTSCTAALHLAAMALGLGEGDEVIVPAFTWVTSAHCAEYVGAKAVFADVSPATFNISPESVRKAITSRTRAIVAVHLFGLAAPMDELCAIAKAHGLKIIEDAACAIGTTYRSRSVGAIGDIGCFSFHPRKVITTGEGGMVTTDDAVLADKVAALRNHGNTGFPASDPQGRLPQTMGTYEILGYNLRLSDILAAVGVSQYAKLDGLLAERRSIAERYIELLREIPEVISPVDDSGGGHTYQSFVIRVATGGRPRRDAVMEGLARKGVSTRPGTHAVHRLAYYASKYGIAADAYPNANLCEDTSITLPIFPGMTVMDQNHVVAALKSELKAI